MIKDEFVYIIKKPDMTDDAVLLTALRGHGFLLKEKAQDKLNSIYKEIEECLSFKDTGMQRWAYENGLKRQKEYEGSKIVTVKLVAEIK